MADRDRAQMTGRGVPFFSGREAEISAFRKVANALLLGRQGNATIVVEGPPGAGKSALMGQFMEEMRSFPPAGSGRRWLPVEIDAEVAESPADIADEIDRAIVARLAKGLLATSEGREASGTLGAALRRVRGARKGTCSVPQRACRNGPVQQSPPSRQRDHSDEPLALRGKRNGIHARRGTRGPSRRFLQRGWKSLLDAYSHVRGIPSG